MQWSHFAGALVALLTTASVKAEVLAASDTHYSLRQQAYTELPLEATWERLIHPERWWSPAHSYSGDAANFDLEPRAGGLWREHWPGGSVAHGRVLLVQEGQVLRLEAPFGPLQGLGAYVVWTISLDAAEEGTRITFEEVATAPSGSDLATLARAVDAVKTEAITRLAAP